MEPYYEIEDEIIQRIDTDRLLASTAASNIKKSVQGKPVRNWLLFGLRHGLFGQSPMEYKELAVEFGLTEYRCRTVVSGCEHRIRMRAAYIKAGFPR